MRLLVVDNYAPFARSLRLMLSAEHQVEVRESGAEALQLLRSGAEFDAILCDLLMPEVSGMDLHRALAQEGRGRETLLVFLTGGAHTDDAREFLARVPNARLEKPFPPDALRAILEGMRR